MRRHGAPTKKKNENQKTTCRRALAARGTAGTSSSSHCGASSTDNAPHATLVVENRTAFLRRIAPLLSMYAIATPRSYEAHREPSMYRSYWVQQRNRTEAEGRGHTDENGRLDGKSTQYRGTFFFVANGEVGMDKALLFPLSQHPRCWRVAQVISAVVVHSEVTQYCFKFVLPSLALPVLRGRHWLANAAASACVSTELGGRMHCRVRVFRPARNPTIHKVRHMAAVTPPLYAYHHLDLRYLLPSPTS